MFIILLLIALCLRATSSDPAHDYSKYKLQPRDLGVNGRVGMFTPFGLVPGGGERYFLASALTFVHLGYKVDIMLYEDARCVDRECIQRTLNLLRVPLSFDTIAIRYISANDTIVKLTNNKKVLKEVPMGYYEPTVVNSFPGQGDIFAGKNGRVTEDYWAIDSERYEIFFNMGNTKYPAFQAIGKFNFYMCQFPFDLKPAQSRTDYKHGIWNTYDKILVNSKFTMNWYIRVMRTGVNRGLNRGLYYSHFPTVTILYPPVEPFQKFSTYGNKKGNQMSLTTQDATVDDIKQLMVKKVEQVRVISVFGRFFRGRQSKGHDVALTLFAQLVEKIPDVPIHLYLVGFVQPNSWGYVEDLKVNATRLGIRDKVFLYTNSTGEQVGHVLLKTTFLWHLAGVRWLREAQYFDNYEPAAVTHTVVLYGVVNRPNVIAYDLDPASLEHFGIAIVEAMFSGVIPIVGALGGTTDIVQENFNGLYAEQIDDFVLHVERLLKGPTSEIERLSRNAISSANLFSTDTFMTNIRYEVMTGIHTHRMRMTSRYHMKAVWRMADLNKVVFRGHSDNAFWFMAQGHLAEHDQQISHAIQMGNKHYGHLRKRVGKRRKNKLFYHNSGVTDGAMTRVKDGNASESVFDKNSQANVAMTRYFDKEAYQSGDPSCDPEKNLGCKKSKKTALLICTGITALLEMIVNNVLYYLGPGWSLTILSHRTADFFVRGTLKGLPNVQYIHLNNTIESRYDFDTTMTDPWFWSMFEPNEKVFLFDMDTLLLKKFNTKKFLSYDFVVGPTRSKCKTPSVVDGSIRKNGLSEFGIGALSLRTAGVMFDISARYTKTDVDESEASFFHRNLLKEGYRVSNEEESHDFAWGTEECPNDYNFDLGSDVQRPFALHALWTYADNLTQVDHLVKTFAVPVEVQGD